MTAAAPLLLALLGAVPSIERPVTDLVNALAPHEIEAIEARLIEHRKACGVQMAVLLVDSTDGRPIEWYSLDVASRWGGGGKGRDDGLLFTLAIEDRRMRLEVGYGLEPSIPDREARRIIDSIKPELRAGDYGAGVAKVVEAVIERTAGFDPVTGTSSWRPPLGTAMPWSYLAVLLLGMLVAALGFGLRNTGIEDSPIWLHALAWGVGPLCVAFVFRHGEGFWAVYPAVFIWGEIIFLIGRAAADTAFFLAPAWWTTTVAVAIAGIVAHEQLVVNDGFDVLIVLGGHVGAQLALVVFGGLALMDAGGGTGSSGGWSSSSSSSSSWSSSSSGGWSGGGGSFGGGGASSSW